MPYAMPMVTASAFATVRTIFLRLRVIGHAKAYLYVRYGPRYTSKPLKREFALCEDEAGKQNYLTEVAGDRCHPRRPRIAQELHQGADPQPASRIAAEGSMKNLESGSELA